MGTWLGVAVSSVGFAVTIYQLRKTRSAAEAATRALGRSRHRYAVNALMASIPELLRAEDQLSTGLRSQKSRDVSVALVAWRHSAARTRGHLGNLESSAEELLADLGVAISLCAASEQALNETTDIAAAMKETHERIGIASSTAASLARQPPRL